MNRSGIPRWIHFPAILALAVVILPLLGLLPKVQWVTFIQDVTDPATIAALVLSGRSAAIATLICIVLGVPLASVIANASSRTATVLRVLVTLPLVLPPLVGGVALLSILGRTGIFGPTLATLGVTVPFTPAAVVIAQTFVALPFLVISVESAMRSVGQDYERVAAGLGAGRSRIFFRVTLPLIRPGLLAGVVLAFARSVGEFGATALLAGNKPGVTQTIPMAIYTAFNGVGTSRQAAMALSVLLIVTALIVLLFFPAARGASSVLGQDVAEQHAKSQEVVNVHPLRTTPAGGQRPRGVPISLDCSVTRGTFTLDVDVNIDGGDVVGVVGANAAGKSTLVNLIAGHIQPATGVLTLGEERFGEGGRSEGPRERNVGHVTQQPLLFPHLDVLDNVAFGPSSRGLAKVEAHARAKELLRQVGVGDQGAKRPHQLSGGQQQRVALARALATHPRVLLLDEPFAAMDVTAAQPLRRLLKELQMRTGVTTILVTHDLLDVLTVADRVLVLDDGGVVEDQPVEEFMTSPRSPFGAALSGINILRTPGGDVVHARESDLAVVEGRGKTSASQQWSGVVDHVEIIGGVARAKIRVDGHLVSVVITKEQVKEVSSAREVRLVLLDRESVSEV